MKYITIPNTSLTVSNLCLGGDAFCKKQDTAYSHKILDTYYELGGTFVDTANIYGKWFPDGLNSNELDIGTWLEQRGNRDKIILATKGGHPPLEDMSVGRLSEKELRLDLEESLRALKTDYIDLYWVHRDDRSTPVSEVAEALNLFIKEGKVRFVGCSNWAPDRIDEFQEYAEKHGLAGFKASQPKWSYARVNEDEFEDKTIYCFDQKARDYHLKTMLPIIPFSPQAKGYFAKLEKDSAEKGKYFPIYDTPDNRERFLKLQKVAKKYGVSANAAAIAYLTHQPFVTIPILGYSSPEQLIDSLKASELSLTKEDMDFLGV